MKCIQNQKSCRYDEPYLKHYIGHYIFNALIHVIVLTYFLLNVFNGNCIGAFKCKQCEL